LRKGVPLLLTNHRVAAIDRGRVAAEHALNRRLNDRLSVCEAAGACGMPCLLVCECGRSECVETIEVSQTEYAAVRSCEGLYLVAPDHQSPGVTAVVLEMRGRFSMVELLPSAEAAAARQEPSSTKACSSVCITN
jgi:hypothetical protein